MSKGLVVYCGNKHAMNVRYATKDDRQSIAGLIHFERYVHRHLEWRTPLEWIGHYPYFLAEQNGKVVSALACPPDPPKVAWIRLFACSTTVSLGNAWDKLWSATLDTFNKGTEKPILVALPTGAWFSELLISSRFKQIDQVIILQWKKTAQPKQKLESHISIRNMMPEDLKEVEQVDQLAFNVIWQNSLEGLKVGYQESTLATVAIDTEKIVGYQISTITSIGGHLARLAVLPAYQHKGIGYALVNNLQFQLSQRGIQNVTVNTQKSNMISLALYQKTDFIPLSDVYPVYQYFF